MLIVMIMEMINIIGLLNAKGAATMTHVSSIRGQPYLWTSKPIDRLVHEGHVNNYSLHLIFGVCSENEGYKW